MARFQRLSSEGPGNGVSAHLSTILDFAASRASARMNDGHTSACASSPASTAFMCVGMSHPGIPSGAYWRASRSSSIALTPASLTKAGRQSSSQSGWPDSQ